MRVGLDTDSLSELSFEAALDAAADAGIGAIEIATGGQSQAPHLDLESLLSSGQGSPPRSVSPSRRSPGARGSSRT